MSCNILFAGFGGQGILFAAKVAAYAGMMAEKEISWLPSYGPEMRGGTSNCAVCIDDAPIASPIVNEPSVFMALNEPSFVKFIDKVVAGGIVVFDSFLISSRTERTDVKAYGIPATKMAKDEGLDGLANIIALGLMAKKTEFLPLETLKQAINKVVPASKQAMIEKNIKALELGYNYQE